MAFYHFISLKQQNILLGTFKSHIDNYLLCYYHFIQLKIETRIKMIIAKRSFKFSVLSAALFLSSTLFAQTEKTAPVSGFARSFITGSIISNADITILETGEKLKTDTNGHFGPINYPIGKPITLELQQSGYKTTQTGTFIVPPQGLSGPYNNITFQVPAWEAYAMLAYVIGANPDDNNCHVAITITDYQKTMDDIPQGEPDAKITLSPNINETPFYFDIFKTGPLKGKTNPFTKGLTQTTDDGGVAFFNLPPLHNNQLYTVSAQKVGLIFTETKFWCRKGAFINISPPKGPMALK